MRPESILSTSLLLLSLLLTAAPPAAATVSADPGASVLETSTFALPQVGWTEGTELETGLAHHSIALPAQGYLFLDLAPVQGTADKPRMLFPPTVRGSVDGILSVGDGLRPVAQAPTWALLEVPGPGIYPVTVRAEQPGAQLAPYRLTSAFLDQDPGPVQNWSPAGDSPERCAAGSPVPGAEISPQNPRLSLGGVYDKTGDCDVVGCKMTGSGLLVVDAGRRPVRASLYRGDACGDRQHLMSAGVDREEHDLKIPVFAGEHRLMIEPQGALGDDYQIDLTLYSPCPLLAEDDHGDVLLCATPMAEEQAGTGRFEAKPGGDHDVWTFEVDAVTTARIDFDADGPAAARLLNADGTVLGRAEVGAEGLARTLGPGRYFVRVAAEAAVTGAYALRLTTEADGTAPH